MAGFYPADTGQLRRAATGLVLQLHPLAIPAQHGRVGRQPGLQLVEVADRSWRRRHDVLANRGVLMLQNAFSPVPKCKIRVEFFQAARGKSLFLCLAGSTVYVAFSPEMKSVRRAVIDVGTNSVKLLVADVAGCDVRPVLEQSRQTRLGRGFYQSHSLQPQAVAATAQAVAAFAIAARNQKAQSVRVVATSVAREANNAGELASAIMHASGLPLEIISGEQEAEWVFQGVATDPALAGLSLLILDIGGGSSEFILGSGAHKHFQASYPLGSVRLMEKLPHSDPPTAAELARCRNWLRDFLDSKVAPELCPALNRETASESPQPVHCASVPEAVQLVGTGGTASILACMELQLSHFDRARIESTPLRLGQVQDWTERLWASPLSERKRIVGLPPNRADVILYGTAIYEAVMVRFEFDQLRISTRGLRFGAILQGQ